MVHVCYISLHLGEGEMTIYKRSWSLLEKFLTGYWGFKGPLLAKKTLPTKTHQNTSCMLYMPLLNIKDVSYCWSK
ncbi:unnamed protein product [Porites evermanni]|uniref:Uncharacterized protein n=1 Tax=Porites evermanni TaxID=104178 RepID=A0ABN8MFB6_9CNID|nr:unnamed protein product [Porites evermanni]